MKLRYILIFGMLTIGLLFHHCIDSENTIKVMSFNVRYDNPDDGSNAWCFRKTAVFSFLNNRQPDIIGFQEVLQHQYVQLQGRLNAYNCVGVGRDDGKNKGEFAPVFYRKEKYELLATSHFWLSESPEKAGSKSWGAALPRIVTWLRLKDRHKGYIFYVFNTHFSHVSCYARNKSAILVLNKIKTIAGEAPVILTGDFNAQPTEEMYSTLTHNWEGYFPLWDSRYLPVTTSKASKQTFNGFNAEAPEVIIDHIFVNGFFDVKTFNTFGFTEDSMYLSDHNPIMAALTFRLKEKTGLGTAEKLMQSVPLPFINSKRLVFKDSVLVEINMQEPTTEVYYTHDGAQPDTEALLYRAPFYLKHSCTLKVRAFADGKHPSETSRRSFIKQSEKPFKLTEVVPTSSTDYSSPGYAALFDGLTGDIEDLKAGSWLGFNGSNVDFLFDLGKKTKLSTCYVSCLSDPGKWIISPSKIEVKVSNDGVGYSSVAQKDIIPSFEASQSQQQVHALQLKEKNARFLKLSVNNGGLLPKSHSADGNPSWLFIDEIVIQ